MYASFADELVKISALKPSTHLREHQEAARQFIEDGGGRGLLAHGTGSGKTLSAIAATEHLRAKGKANKVLVITPASLQTNFKEQGIKKFTKGVTYDGIDGKSDYQTVSYAKFRRDPNAILRASKANTIIADEIHRAKDPGSKTFKTLRSASQDDQIKNFIGLTGSVISNHPRDVVPLMDLVHPNHDLGSQQAFGRKYVEREQVQKGGFLRKPRYRSTLVKRPEVGSKLRPSLSYLSHADLSNDMPRLSVSEVRVPMSDEQNKMYRFALGRLSSRQRRLIREGLPANQSEAQHIFSVIAKARQASNSIGTHREMSDVDAAENTPKLKRVMDDVEAHLKKTPDGQAVVYSNMVRGGADALRAGLKARGHKVGLFSGVGALGTTKDSRDRDAADFKKGKKKIMILTPAASEGLSLDNTTGFFEVDRHFNPERNQQAIARGRRLGGLSHRPKEDRVLEVKRYYSEPKPSFLNRLMGNREVGVDEWIQRVANEKDRLNDELRGSLKGGK